MNIFSNKRLLSMLLAIVMIVSIVPVQFAAATEEEIAPSKDGLSKLTVLVDGEPVALELVEDLEEVRNVTRSTSFTEVESNNTLSLADRIYNDYVVSGYVSSSDTVDLFKITLSSRSDVTFVAVSKYSTLLMGIADSNGYWTDYSYAWDLGYDSDSGTYAHACVNENYESPVLDAGTYYLAIMDEYDSYNPYAFSISWEATTTTHTHSMGIWVTQDEATCVATGTEVRYCSGKLSNGTYCDYYETREIAIDPDAHSIKTLLPEEPGCETTGLTEGSYCELCNTVFTQQQTIPATGHDWDDGVELTPGYITYTCNTCGETKEDSTGEYVAAIGSTLYKTVWDALMAAKSGDTVEMIADSDERGTTLFMGVGVTLDLNTYDLKADGLIGLKGSYLNTDPGRYSSSSDYGRLYVPMDNLVLTSGTAIASSGKNKVIPVWNGVDAYVMANAHINDYDAGYGLTVDQSAKKIDFAFNHVMGGSANTAFLKNGSDDNALRIVIRLSWSTPNGVAYQDFVYNADFVGAVANGGYNYTFSLTGYDVLNIDIETLTVTAMYLTDSGIELPGSVWSIYGAH